MWRSLTEPLDRWAIRMACTSVVEKSGDHHEHEAEELLSSPEFFDLSVGTPDLRFTDQKHFSFTSQIQTRWSVNNEVHGRLYRAGSDWRNRPAVILLHGWNSESSYARQFPFFSWRLNRYGVNSAMFQLPFHGRRRPSGPGTINNFISHDLLNMVEATRQALLDARSLAKWLLEQGCPSVGVWGISLGAWLGGLLACHDPELDFAVLLTPVPNVELAIRELDFCVPIRTALQQKDVDVSRLNLASIQPVIPPERILIVEAQHDIFAPVEVVEEVWKAWNRPAIWRVRHGHISILLSVPLMERTVRWISRAARLPVSCQRTD
jgi:pimeloyl-ACP methyl ester carboxylesterase